MPVEIADFPSSKSFRSPAFLFEYDIALMERTLFFLSRIKVLYLCSVTKKHAHKDDDTRCSRRLCIVSFSLLVCIVSLNQVLT